jgi:hypothetical protein
MKLNLNQQVKVKLTPVGVEALRLNHYADCFRLYPEDLIPEFVPPEVDAEGYTTFQLWILMNQLGPHIGMGKQSVFETFEIQW